MKKELVIEGMSCSHCSTRVEAALNAIDGVSATVDLDTNTAMVDLSKDVNDQDLIDVVKAEGYAVSKIN